MADLNKLAVVVALATTDAIAVIPVRDCQDVSISVKNAGANAFDAFVVKGRAGPNLPWTTLLSASGDYTTPKYPLMRATTDPTTLAGGADTALMLKAAGFYELQVLASSAVAATTADIAAHGY